MKKEALLEQLQEQLESGELRDPSVITRVELGDEKFIDLFLEKTQANQAAQEVAETEAPAEAASEAEGDKE